MASQSEGIQKLLDAEKEATRLVDEARKYKMKRLKEAKSEARIETEQFQKEHEEKFAKVTKTFEDGKMSNEIAKQVNDTIKQMDIRVKENQARVVQTLVDGIKNIVLELPRNYTVTGA